MFNDWISIDRLLNIVNLIKIIELNDLIRENVLNLIQI